MTALPSKVEKKVYKAKQIVRISTQFGVLLNLTIFVLEIKSSISFWILNLVTSRSTRMHGLFEAANKLQIFLLTSSSCALFWGIARIFLMLSFVIGL